MLLVNSIEARQEEIYSYKVTLGLLFGATTFFLVAALLEACFYFLYNFKVGNRQHKSYSNRKLFLVSSKQDDTSISRGRGRKMSKGGFNKEKLLQHFRIIDF